jgi:hypothetical protein
MKRFLAILLCVLFFVFAGLYTRPSYILIGQLNWIDVLTKGYFLGSVRQLFTQGMVDESFFWVLKFSAAGLFLGILMAFLIDSKKSKKSKKKKA